MLVEYGYEYFEMDESGHLEPFHPHKIKKEEITGNTIIGDEEIPY